MSFFLRCVVLALASFGLAALAAAVAVALTWRWPAGTAAQRADQLWRMRLLPLAVAAATSVFAVTALVRFESRQTDEIIGWTLLGSATLGAAFLAAFVARLLQMHLETRRLLKTWLANARRIALPELAGLGVPVYRIETHFPIVAVVGMVRPTLVIDASVLDACNPAELTAILAHERGHLRRRDNMRRALFSATPDLLARARTGPHLCDAWREATEEAADDAAAEQGEDVRVHLAQALVRVARLARMAAPTPWPASTLYRGDAVERRVRRLLNPAGAVASNDRSWVVAAMVAAALVLALALQQQIHGMMEVAVNGLW